MRVIPGSARFCLLTSLTQRRSLGASVMRRQWSCWKCMTRLCAALCRIWADAKSSTLATALWRPSSPPPLLLSAPPVFSARFPGMDRNTKIVRLMFGLASLQANRSNITTICSDAPCNWPRAFVRTRGHHRFWFRTSSPSCAKERHCLSKTLAKLRSKVSITLFAPTLSPGRLQAPPRLKKEYGVVGVLACRAVAFAKADSALTIWAVQKELPRIKNFIDGQFVEPVGGKYLDNIEPATRKPYSQLADSGKADVDPAVAAAEAAFVDWSKKPAAERSKVLLRIADLIERDLAKPPPPQSIDTRQPLSLP